MMRLSMMIVHCEHLRNTGKHQVDCQRVGQRTRTSPLEEATYTQKKPSHLIGKNLFNIK